MLPELSSKADPAAKLARHRSQRPLAWSPRPAPPSEATPTKTSSHSATALGDQGVSVRSQRPGAVGYRTQGPQAMRLRLVLPGSLHTSKFSSLKLTSAHWTALPLQSHSRSDPSQSAWARVRLVSAVTRPRGWRHQVGCCVRGGTNLWYGSLW